MAEMSDLKGIGFRPLHRSVKSINVATGFEVSDILGQLRAGGLASFFEISGRSFNIPPGYWQRITYDKFNPRRKINGKYKITPILIDIRIFLTELMVLSKSNGVKSEDVMSDVNFILSSQDESPLILLDAEETSKFCIEHASGIKKAKGGRPVKIDWRAVTRSAIYLALEMNNISEPNLKNFRKLLFNKLKDDPNVMNPPSMASLKLVVDGLGE